jgi:hypothetical protein
MNRMAEKINYIILQREEYPERVALIDIGSVRIQENLMVAKTTESVIHLGIYSS